MKIIEDLRQTNSRIEKEQLLKYANELDKKVFYYAYHPHMRYGINSIAPIDELGEPSKAMFNLLDKLANNNINDSLRQEVEDFRAEHGDLITLICRKDLDCGVTATTINKVYHKLIPVFKVQLAKEIPLEKLSYPLTAQIKYDGVRVVILAANGWCKLLTRNGKLINFPQLSDTLAVLLQDITEGVMIDGELTNKQGTMSGRTSISGRVNSALKGGILTDKDIQFTAFDGMTLSEFNSGSCRFSYEVRYERTRQIVECIDNATISMADNIVVNNAQEANDYYTSVLEQGYEGLILKDMAHKYTFKRSKDWVKVKAIKSADLTCDVAVHGKPGTKYAEDIGALECYGKVEGKQVKVSVGSGLSDAERQYGINYFNGKTIEIKYNDVIRNAEDDGWTLFLPRFISMRFDK